MRSVAVGPVTIANDRPLVLVSGPCQLESRDHALFLADRLAAICRAAGVPFVFKGSFDKANRTALDATRGVGMDAGLSILAEVRDATGCPVTTDVHDVAQVAPVAKIVDLLQIPAFLSRQTDLLVAAGRTGRPVNVKKGQFLAPWDMAAVAEKVASGGKGGVILTDRGASFGYNALVSDPRALAIMAETGWPVMLDATHSTQAPGGQGRSSGGDRRFAPLLARAAAAVGVAGIFAEVHEDPDRAPSDGPVMLPLDRLAPLLGQLVALDRIAKERPRDWGY